MDRKNDDPYAEAHEALKEFTRKLEQLSSDLMAKRMTPEEYDEIRHQLRRNYEEKMDEALAIVDRRLGISSLH